MKLPVTYILASTIGDAWFQCVSKVQEVGFRYEIQQGSFVGQTRLEFDHITVQIEHPYSEPYDTMLPDIPPHLGIPNPVAPGYIEQYLPYLMTDYIEPGEQYTYGSRIVPQLDWLITLLQKTPNTNQAVLQVAQPSDHKLSDPPCLRHIDIRVKENTGLIFYPYFRSWDLYSGFPANLAGLAVLQKYIADSLAIPVGPVCASSKGLHLYGYVEELAKLRCRR